MAERTTDRDRHDWAIHYRRWQDIVAFLAGVWLIAMIPSAVSTASHWSSFFSFVGGSLAVMTSAAAMQDNTAVFSWAAAAGGGLGIVGGLLAGGAGEPVAFWYMGIGGAVVVLMEVWSALGKPRHSAAPSTDNRGSDQPRQ